jgi:hypothetical protein
VKASGCFYSCAAFNVPEKLAFGNVFTDPLRLIVERASESAYVRTVRSGGLRALGDIVPGAFTTSEFAPGFCDACRMLIDAHDEASGQVTGLGCWPGKTLIPLEPVPVGGLR